MLPRDQHAKAAVMSSLRPRLLVAIQVFKKVNRLNLHFLLQEIVSHLYSFIYQWNIVAKVATKLEFLVAKLKVVAKLATVSVAVSSPARS